MSNNRRATPFGVENQWTRGMAASDGWKLVALGAHTRDRMILAKFHRFGLRIINFRINYHVNYYSNYYINHFISNCLLIINESLV